ncbi:winged helix-turn-helix transcriptional regulator [Paenibacillus athensensis]|uniref:Transcriptional regulator n=1 Tax=Paenibacillus athensensis TaxID=1967502 RepID=A0A4Y8PX35_9BACL|nr:metalloregulator ArsR/SmtB family transcription factor [Paenibacillus athensensis]MCD1258860.1 winged helix-turn-helix transcriptional regulator [Paenibacillus athensensis]
MRNELQEKQIGQTEWQNQQEQNAWELPENQPDQQLGCESSCTGTEAKTALKERQLTEETAVGVAELFKALGDPTRVKLIYTLLQRELCVHDLSEALDMGQSAISHQLRYLRNLHIVKRRKAGKTVYYSLDDMHIEQIFVQTLQHLQHM